MITEAFRKLFKKLLDENGGGGSAIRKLYAPNFSAPFYTDAKLTKEATVKDVESFPYFIMIDTKTGKETVPFQYTKYTNDKEVWVRILREMNGLTYSSGVIVFGEESNWYEED